jgi:hypothetical protein
MADMDRIELLVGLSNNLRSENDQWRRDVFREGAERAKRVLALITRLEEEYAALSAERDVMLRYLPREQQDPTRLAAKQEQTPRAVAANAKQGS